MELIIADKEKYSITPTDFQYYEGLCARRIILNDEVSEDIVDRVILPLMQMDADGSGSEITIILNTPGGSLFDGMVLCDVIDQLQTPTKIIVLGYAYSMGSYFLMAGYNNPNVKKVCYPHSTALIHDGSAEIDGTSSKVKDTLRFQEAYEQKIKSYVLSHSKITEEEYDRHTRMEWYLTSDQMLELGLVDEVIGA